MWIFIIKGFQTIVFIFIVISTMFWPICPLAFFRCFFYRTREPSRNFELCPLLNPWLWLTESEQATPMDSIKDVVRSSVKVPEFNKKTPEEGRRTYQPKRCGNNNKDEDNSSKTLDIPKHWIY